jgi:AraC family transcriptional regulator, transcriptional activator of pobA
MYKIENIEDFYQRKIGWLSDNFNQTLGHFNVFLLAPYVFDENAPHTYARRDFYKIMLVNGGGTVHYADTTIDVKQQALSFSNPQIPYQWENKHLIDN